MERPIITRSLLKDLIDYATKPHYPKVFRQNMFLSFTLFYLLPFRIVPKVLIVILFNVIITKFWAFAVRKMKELLEEDKRIRKEMKKVEKTTKN